MSVVNRTFSRVEIAWYVLSPYRVRSVSCRIHLPLRIRPIQPRRLLHSGRAGFAFSVSIQYPLAAKSFLSKTTNSRSSVPPIGVI